jgi:hypothetical protein
MSDLPRPPSHVSPGVKEIWDWVGKFSEAIHKRDEVSKLCRALHEPNKCGDCTYWMKSSQCPREQSSIRGYSTGPSMNAWPCSKFTQSRASTEHRRKLAEQLVELERTP